MITLLLAKTTRGWDEIFKINLKFSNICNNEIQFWLQRARRISTTSRLGWTNNKQHVDANGSSIESANINRQYTILSRFSQRAARVRFSLFSLSLNKNPTKLLPLHNTPHSRISQILNVDECACYSSIGLILTRLAWKNLTELKSSFQTNPSVISVWILKLCERHLTRHREKFEF